MSDTHAGTGLFQSTDGQEIYYRRSGRGPVLLLLHGTTSSLQHFDRATAILEHDFDVIRPDLPGFGLTGARSDRDYRVATYAHTMAEFMSGLGVDEYVIAGNSLGGNIAWNMALDYPQRTSAAILVNATGYPEKSLPTGMRLARNPVVGQAMRMSMPRRMVERGLIQAVGAESDIVNDAMVDRVHKLWNHGNNRSAFVDFVNTDQIDRTSQLSQIGVPVLVLRSASIDSQYFARDIPDAVEYIHPSTGHLLPEEAPAWFADHVNQFVSTIGGKQ